MGACPVAVAKCALELLGSATAGETVTGLEVLPSTPYRTLLLFESGRDWALDLGAVAIDCKGTALPVGVDADDDMGDKWVRLARASVGWWWFCPVDDAESCYPGSSTRLARELLLLIPPCRVRGVRIDLRGCVLHVQGRRYRTIPVHITRGSSEGAAKGPRPGAREYVEYLPLCNGCFVKRPGTAVSWLDWKTVDCDRDDSMPTRALAHVL